MWWERRGRLWRLFWLARSRQALSQAFASLCDSANRISAGRFRNSRSTRTITRSSRCVTGCMTGLERCGRGGQGGRFRFGLRGDGGSTRSRRKTGGVWLIAAVSAWVLGPAATLIPAFSLKGEGERAASGGWCLGSLSTVWDGESAGAAAVDSVSDCYGLGGVEWTAGVGGVLWLAVGARARWVRGRPSPQPSPTGRGSKSRIGGVSDTTVLAVLRAVDSFPDYVVRRGGCGELMDAGVRIFGLLSLRHGCPEDPSPISAEDGRICLSPRRGEAGSGAGSYASCPEAPSAISGEDSRILRLAQDRFCLSHRRGE